MTSDPSRSSRPALFPATAAVRRGARLPQTALALVAAAALGLAGCGQQQPQAQAAPPPPEVIVANPIKKTVVDQDEYVGRFVAVNAIEIRARVSGYLEKVHFRDGQMVKEGDLLFSIDPRPFQNTVAQARATLEQARSALSYATADLNRGQQLVRDKTITEQLFEQRQQAKRNAEASVAANEALMRQAELDLQFTELKAPAAGRIGDRRVAPGNLVTGGTGGNTTLLATIQSIDPMRFEFTFDEAAYLRYTRLAGGAPKLGDGSHTMKVKLKLLDEANFEHDGVVDFVDNAIDRSTGTIRGRAEVANSKGVFTPGMFARVQVPGSAPYETLLVPEAAIGTEQARKFVLVIDAENTARQKYVTLGNTFEGLRAIKSGVDAGDRIIVNGLMRVRAGQKVTPKDQQPAAAGTGPQAQVR